MTKQSIYKVRIGSLFVFLLYYFLPNSLNAQLTKITDYVIFGGLQTPIAQQTPPLAPGYAVQIGSSSTIQGGSIGSFKLVKSTGNLTIGTNTVLTNIYSGGTIQLNNSNVVTGRIAASNLGSVSGTILSIGSSATLGGNIDVKGNIVIGGGTVSGIVTHPLGTTYTGPTPAGGNVIGTPNLPILPSLPSITTFPSVGATNITSTQTITPGSYGNVALGGNKTLTLSGPGIYVFNSIKNSGTSNNFIFDFKNQPGTIKIYVVGDVDLGKVKASTVNPGTGAESRIFLETHGKGTSSDPVSFKIANGSAGNASKWIGSVWAPYAAINLGSGTGSTNITGALWSGTQVNIQSGISMLFAPFTFPKNIIGAELQSIYDNNTTSSPFFVIADGYVTIDVIVKSGFYDSVLHLLRTAPYGLIDTITNGNSSFIITGKFPIINLPKLNLLGDIINYCRPYYQPSNNIGLKTSAGDTTIRSYLVRSGYKINGDSIKIGVISNSYTTILNGTTTPLKTNTAAQDVANGDLPGDTTFVWASPPHSVNPNGYTKNVHVLQDFPFKSSDEGRAMLQIIHDVAPGAELYFRTGFFTAGDFAKGINELKQAGCNIIVDDVTYMTEPFLKDGVVAKTVDSVTAQGVTYFSSAGNFANRSYEKNFNPVDASAIGFIGKKAHDFSGTGDLFQKVRLAPGNYTFVFQWEDSIYSVGETSGTKNDLDIYLTDHTDGTGLIGFNRDNINGDPIEFIPVTIPGTDSSDYNILIVNNTTTSNPSRIKYIVFSGGIRIMEYNEGNSTLVGQANAARAIAVGAARYDKAPPFLNPPLIESFSSFGGTMTNGVIRQKPEIVAPDGVNTTVKMGQDYPNSAPDGYSNFFGTSAAAPHAAAVAALIMQGRKKFLNQPVTIPDTIRSLLTRTATDMATPGFDFISGYGLINADSAMKAFAAPTAIIDSLLVPVTNPRTIPGDTVFTVTVKGENISNNSIIYLKDSALASTHVINSNLATAVIPKFDDNPSIRVYTPPYPTTNGTDGGFSNSLYFFQGNIIVTAESITKKYGELLPSLDTTITINGVLLQDTTLTLADIGLSKLTVTTAATTNADVGTYLITPSGHLDPSNAIDSAFLKKFHYKFNPGTVTIDKMPLKVTPNDKTITYGHHLGDVTFKYDYDSTNVPNPASLDSLIRVYHQGFLPNNTLAVVKDFLKIQADSSHLDTTALRNLNMIATLKAVKNSRKFKLENNRLVPLTNPNTFNVQYLVDVASESIFEYKIDPSKTKLYEVYPGVNSKGLLGEAYLVNNSTGQIQVNNNLVQMVNGTLVQSVNSINGPMVPILNGTLVQTVNGQFYPISNGTLVQAVNGTLVQTVNGEFVAIPNGSIVQFTNGTLVQAVNGTMMQLINNQQVPIINGASVTNISSVPDSALVQLFNGTLVQKLNGTLQQMVNGTLVQAVNASSVQIANGTLVQTVNSNTIGANSVNSNTAVIIDKDDALPSQNNWLGPMFGINMITGLNAGQQFLVPGILVNSNFDITYGLGTVNILPDTITVKADSLTRQYGDPNPPLTVKYSGFAPGDSLQNSITGVPSLSTTATASSPVSPPTYPILVSQGTLSSTNYVFRFVNAILTVTNNPCLLTHSEFKNFGNTTTVPTSLWLNMTTKVSGQLNTNGDYLLFKAGTVTFNFINSTPLVNNLAIPNGKIIADSTVSTPITSYDAASNTWITKVPVGFASTSDIFMTGAIINSSNGFVKSGGNTGSVLKGMFYCTKSFNDQWAYAIAAYQPQFSYSNIGAPGQVVSINGTYRAGTPTTQLQHLVNGGSGGGGNNYTGSSSSFDNFTACPVTGPSLPTSRSGNSPYSVEEIKDIPVEKEFQVIPNPASDYLTLSFVPTNTGNSKITMYSIDGWKVFETDFGVCIGGNKYLKKINVNKLVGGIYLVQLWNAGKVTTKKIIIAR